MMSQIEMYRHFLDSLNSHTVDIVSNKIKGKKKYTTGRFSSFVITFLKNGKVSINAGGCTLRYDNHDDLFSLMGAFARFK
ncbi:hypothetical protein [Paenibacillus donghaensis]|uniref:Uncharacterized protein n=1 Tax=Paenibacillus donghaensis TaxID=414771 RepID=A0A2Z2KFG5_9BACL|nr:hypothetical protein [Paenibacillus donghaensis]ASA22725.1 hypothetical protein B9T62_19150 [Paenibacillus donghaensis]